VLLASISCAAGAQTRAECERQYTPQRGQEGKDVIWMPTEDSMLGRMLEMAGLTAADKLYDLGSGDGKIPIAAAKRFGATAVGIEYDAALVEHARCLAAAEGVADRVTFIQGDIFESDFSDATVVALYLTPQLNLRLQPTLLALKPGTRIVAYSFGIGDWQPDRQIDSLGDGSAFLWIVPADAGGHWELTSRGGEPSYPIDLEQSFQNLSGSAGSAAVIGKLHGERIELKFAQGGEEVRVMGSVDGERLTATVTRAGRSADYVGTRR
jgi:SAM-dependent methyltransferase